MVVFANGKGKFSYITKNKVSSDFISSQGSKIRLDEKGRAVITLDFSESDAAILWFGIKDRLNSFKANKIY